MAERRCPVCDGQLTMIIHEAGRPVIYKPCGHTDQSLSIVEVKDVEDRSHNPSVGGDEEG